MDDYKCWITPADSKDIPFIPDIAGRLPDSGCPVDRFRLLAAGISSGGAMISRFVQTWPCPDG